ncbi:hypothetical protein MBLNU230_g8282t1 [Neophaeotheca triangularis]
MGLNGALPAYFAYIDDSQHRVPVRATQMSVLLVVVPSLLNLANEGEFSVLISFMTFGLYPWYFIVIACMHA